jgi:hypothetical protein
VQLTTLTDILIVVLVLGAVTVYLSSLAGRLDRLHRKIETAHAALDAQLLRRVAATQDLSSAAQSAFVVDPEDDARRSLVESELTRTLGTVFESREDADEIVEAAWPDADVADQLVEELAVACRRVELARRFHNDVVRSCLDLRRRRISRWFRLAGHTPLPAPIDFDDTPPAGLATR